MNILFASSEVEPFIKTGGLADVSSALPKALKKEGHDVRIILPLYSSIDRQKYKLKEKLGSSCVHMGNCEEWFKIFETKLGTVKVYFIEFEKYFARDGIYHTKAGEYPDNAYRFSFFSRAVLQASRDLGFVPDVIHCNDWQTALIPYAVKTYPDEYFSSTATVLTIHNIAYQGVFSDDVLPYAKIFGDDFTPLTFESFGAVNFLKGGIAYADKITTVSPTYAEEILGPVGSGGLHGILNYRKDDLTGILNGIDYAQWNPKTDKLIPANFSVNKMQGKTENKLALQKQFGLTVDEDIALFGFVGRFAHQKGLTLIAEMIERAVSEMACQFVILGSGDAEYEEYFAKIPYMYPGKTGSYIGFSNELAHLVEAGSDFFLMPSLFEPCGLNQMYSLAYGTLPIVRTTGGLADTVDNYIEDTGGGTGFRFDAISAQALFNTVGWAVSTYYDRPEHIKKMRKTAMKKDFGWTASADKYISLYNEALQS